MSPITQFLLGLTATAFGVFLGLWTTSIRERIVRRRADRTLVQTALVELQHLVANLNLLKNGIHHGSMAPALGATPEIAVTLNLPNRPTVTMKALEDLRLSTKKQFRLFFQAMQTAGNAERLYRNLERLHDCGVPTILLALDNAMLEYRRLSWDLRNIVTNENIPFDDDIWNQCISEVNDTGDIGVLLRKRGSASKTPERSVDS